MDEAKRLPSLFLLRSRIRFPTPAPLPYIWRIMSLPEFIVFTPVPLRARRDGWSPALQLRFIRLLADGMKPGAAAEAVGRNRQNAYALRKRPGAESFAAAWDAAVAY